jgi:hypothetical protein
MSKDFRTSQAFRTNSHIDAPVAQQSRACQGKLWRRQLLSLATKNTKRHKNECAIAVLDAFAGYHATAIRYLQQTRSFFSCLFVLFVAITIHAEVWIVDQLKASVPSAGRGPAGLLSVRLLEQLRGEFL